MKITKDDVITMRDLFNLSKSLRSNWLTMGDYIEIESGRRFVYYPTMKDYEKTKKVEEELDVERIKQGWDYAKDSGDAMAHAFQELKVMVR